MPCSSARRAAGLFVVAAACAVITLPAAAQGTPQSTSAGAAKALVAALQAKSLDAYAMRDTSQTNRFVAVILEPKVSLLVAAATYSRPTDLEYRFFQKDYAGAYKDLRAGLLATDKVSFEDQFCDGLMVFPGRGQMVHDAAVLGTTRREWDGEGGPYKKGDKKLSRDEYFKAYVAADAQYTTLLNMLVEALKGSSTLR